MRKGKHTPRVAGSTGSDILGSRDEGPCAASRLINLFADVASYEDDAAVANRGALEESHRVPPREEDDAPAPPEGPPPIPQSCQWAPVPRGGIRRRSEVHDRASWPVPPHAVHFGTGGEVHVAAVCPPPPQLVQRS